MHLIELKYYLRTVKEASLFDLCRTLKVKPEILRDMLQIWIRKGKVCQVMRKDACGKSCTQCDPLLVERYSWVETS